MSGKSTILLVTTCENTYHNRVLESRGYEVTRASTYAHARTTLRDRSFDLVLVIGDAHRGNEFCEEMKEEFPQQKIAIMTGAIESLPDNACPDDVIQTHYDPAAFLRRVEQLV